jgi:DNA-binding NarL/FixJ family response regulator
LAHGTEKLHARLLDAAKTLLTGATTTLTLMDRVEWENTEQSIQNLLDDPTHRSPQAVDRMLTLQQIVDFAFAKRVAAEADHVPPGVQPEKERCCDLTARECEVATLIARGKSNRAIAEELSLGVKSIETYVTRILSKLGLSSRVQIALWAVEKGLTL